MSRIIAAGFPTAYRDRSNLEGCVTPRVFIQSTHDEFGAVDDLRATFDALPEPRQLHPDRSAGSLFNGGLEQLEEEVVKLGRHEFARTIASSSTSRGRLQKKIGPILSARPHNETELEKLPASSPAAM